ncbi:MAG TPA: polyhydroxybutyrate depolymerase, partial [Candidatus Eisenbacteria bacterium]|nr:polyhydroxybutyrate depolymerase [Candidatus Eisenbacteria bacterium]
MRRLIFLAAMTAALWPAAASAHEDASLVFDGHTRAYHVHAPADLSSPRPLVFVFHGSGGDGSEIE